jgi:predicted enzyme related to lactoylglutathione lyase
MPTIVAFEIPADDVERARKFYNEVFGWKIYKASDLFEYWIFDTSADNRNANKPSTPSPSVVGGMVKRQHPEQKIINYIGVSSIEEYSNKIQNAGGKVVIQKTTVPNHGYFAICLDTEDNSFAIWKSDPDSK